MSKEPQSPGSGLVLDAGDLDAQMDALDAMPLTSLQATFREVFGFPDRTHNRPHLVKRLRWRLQELAEGGLSEAALRKIDELGDWLPDAWKDRPAPPTVAEAAERDPRLPPAGSTLRRKHGDVIHEVLVCEDGFLYAGEHFKNLSAVAKRISGTIWSGFAFFGLAGPPRKKGAVR